MQNRHRTKHYNNYYTFVRLFMLLLIATLIIYCNYKTLFKAVICADAVVLFLFVLIKVIKSYRKKKRLLNSRIHEIDHMTGEQFEELLAAHFKANGYKVTLTKKSNDYGGDLIIKKDGITTVVQAKRYKNKVGIAAVQQAYTAIKHYGADYSMVITNSYFTSSAKNLAKEADVELWDREKLIDTFSIADR